MRSDADMTVLTGAAVDPPGYGQPGGLVLDELAQALWLHSFERNGRLAVLTKLRAVAWLTCRQERHIPVLCS